MLLQNFPAYNGHKNSTLPLGLVRLTNFKQERSGFGAGFFI